MTNWLEQMKLRITATDLVLSRTDHARAKARCKRLDRFERILLKHIQTQMQGASLAQQIRTLDEILQENGYTKPEPLLPPSFRERLAESPLVAATVGRLPGERKGLIYGIPSAIASLLLSVNLFTGIGPFPVDLFPDTSASETIQGDPTDPSADADIIEALRQMRLHWGQSIPMKLDPEDWTKLSRNTAYLSGAEVEKGPVELSIEKGLGYVTTDPEDDKSVHLTVRDGVGLVNYGKENAKWQTATLEAHDATVAVDIGGNATFNLKLQGTGQSLWLITARKGEFGIRMPFGKQSDWNREELKLEDNYQTLLTHQPSGSQVIICSPGGVIRHFVNRVTDFLNFTNEEPNVHLFFPE